MARAVPASEVTAMLMISSGGLGCLGCCTLHSAVICQQEGSTTHASHEDSTLHLHEPFELVLHYRLCLMLACGPLLLRLCKRLKAALLRMLHKPERGSITCPNLLSWKVISHLPGSDPSMPIAGTWHDGHEPGLPGN